MTFLLNTDVVLLYDYLLKLFLAVVCGGIIGWERYVHKKPAGFRTLILVCIGATLVTMISASNFPGEEIRIIAGVMTGIGFLGAGAVLSSHGAVHGLTTAASIWVIAAIGSIIGIGAYMLAIIATLLTFVILRSYFIEEKYKP